MFQIKIKNFFFNLRLLMYKKFYKVKLKTTADLYCYINLNFKNVIKENEIKNKKKKKTT